MVGGNGTLQAKATQKNLVLPEPWGVGTLQPGGSHTLLLTWHTHKHEAVSGPAGPDQPGSDRPRAQNTDYEGVLSLAPKLGKKSHSGRPQKIQTPSRSTNPVKERAQSRTTEL